MRSITDFVGKPIGIIEEGISRERIRKSKYEVVSRVRVYEPYAAGLAGLDGYSHIIVVWWINEEHQVRSQVTPWERTDMPEVGIFATRFPPRPNHIGVSVVKLLKVSGDVLSVKGLDAWNGSPVLDIKPYDYYDMVKSVRVPDWFRKYWEEHSARRKAANVTWLGP
jgi:tRNA-Thr(GGU) m(6)t(6)A37 methyltransferase TsaA